MDGLLAGAVQTDRIRPEASRIVTPPRAATPHAACLGLTAVLVLEEQALIVGGPDLAAARTGERRNRAGRLDNRRNVLKRALDTIIDEV